MVNRMNDPRYKQFVRNAMRSPAMCIHLKEAIENADYSVSMHPVFEQNFMSDSFISFWFCDNCRKKCGFSTKGVYVFNKNYDELLENDVTLVNPFASFINENISYTLPAYQFSNFFNQGTHSKKPEECEVVDFEIK